MQIYVENKFPLGSSGLPRWVEFVPNSSTFPLCMHTHTHHRPWTKKHRFLIERLSGLHPCPLTFPVFLHVFAFPCVSLSGSENGRRRLQCAWAPVLRVCWCPAVSFATHSPLSAWNTPCSLEKENLTLSIRTSTMQRWNTIPLTSPSSFSFSIDVYSLRPFPLHQTCPETFLVLLVILLLLCSRQRRWKAPASARSLFLFCSRAPILNLCLPPVWFLFWGNIQNRLQRRPSWPCYEFSS